MEEEEPEEPPMSESEVETIRKIQSRRASIVGPRSRRSSLVLHDVPHVSGKRSRRPSLAENNNSIGEEAVPLESIISEEQLAECE